MVKNIERLDNGMEKSVNYSNIISKDNNQEDFKPYLIKSIMKYTRFDSDNAIKALDQSHLDRDYIKGFVNDKFEESKAVMNNILNSNSHINGYDMDRYNFYLGLIKYYNA